jgi:hypothetical protein
MAKMDWEKAARRDSVEKVRPLPVGSKTPMISNKQAKRLASLQRKAGLRYTGHGMTRREAGKEIARLEHRLKLGRGEPVVKDKQSKTDADVWWWVPAKFSARCSTCSEPMPKGTTVAYNHHERRALCEVCCEREGHVPQLSAAAKNLRRDAA